MISRVPDYILERIADSIDEMKRLRELSNQDLVIEYLKLTSDEDDEMHVNEMMNRLWPGWETTEL